MHFFMPVPYMALKVLRIARLLRVFRYMKAFSILSRAFAAKKNEMVVSLQFLTILPTHFMLCLNQKKNKLYLQKCSQELKGTTLV